MNNFVKTNFASSTEAESPEVADVPLTEAESPEVADVPLVKGSVSEKRDKIGDIIEDNTVQLSTRAVAMRDTLAKQPVVSVVIPLEVGEIGRETYKDFCLNGFKFFVKKGSYQSVPKQVADIISESYGYGDKILSEHKLNLKNSKLRREALGLE